MHVIEVSINRLSRTLALINNENEVSDLPWESNLLTSSIATGIPFTLKLSDSIEEALPYRKSLTCNSSSSRILPLRITPHAIMSPISSSSDSYPHKAYDRSPHNSRHHSHLIQQRAPTANFLMPLTPLKLSPQVPYISIRPCKLTLPPNPLLIHNPSSKASSSTKPSVELTDSVLPSIDNFPSPWHILSTLTPLLLSTAEKRVNPARCI